MSTDTHLDNDSKVNTPVDENPNPEKANEQQDTFVETALKLSGKSAEEARSTGAVDRADEQVEALFATKYQTTNSPAHRAVWRSDLDISTFMAQDVTPPSAELQKVMDDSLEVTRRRRDAGTLLNAERKITPESFGELGQAGYWGLLVDKQYGGSAASFVNFAKFLTRMATVDPTVAGLASVHGCIGAVDPLRTFGNDHQKQKYLPLLASGEKLSAFALTEPAAGSDLTALPMRFPVAQSVWSA